MTRRYIGAPLHSCVSLTVTARVCGVSAVVGEEAAGGAPDPVDLGVRGVARVGDYVHWDTIKS